MEERAGVGEGMGMEGKGRGDGREGEREDGRWEMEKGKWEMKNGTLGGLVVGADGWVEWMEWNGMGTGKPGIVRVMVQGKPPKATSCGDPGTEAEKNGARV